MLPEYLKKEVIAACALLDNPEYGGSEEDIILSLIAERRAKLAEEVELGLTIRSPMISIRLLAEIELLRGELAVAGLLNG